MHSADSKTKLFRFDGSFRDKNKEKEFINNQWAGYSRRIRVTALLTGLAYLSGIYLDAHCFPGKVQFYYLMVMRILVFISAISCFLVTFRNRSGRLIQNVLFIYVLLITLSECLELFLKPEMGLQGLPLLLIVILFYYLVFPVQLPYAFAGSLLAAILYNLILLVLLRYQFREVLLTPVAFVLITATSITSLKALNKARRGEYDAVSRLSQANRLLKNEIAQKQRIQDRLEELATTDPLTGVYNRRYFNELAQRELIRSRRMSRPLSFMMMDIDLFKSVNDSYGHAVGDMVLKSIASTCKNAIREMDAFCRYGGEEFIFLLPETNSSHAAKMAERMRKMIEELTINVEGAEVKVTASFGISDYDGSREVSLKNIVKHADQAMYLAKEGGRNRIEIIRSMEISKE